MGKICKKLIICFVVVITLFELLYLFALPKMVSSKKVLNSAEKIVKKTLNADLVIKNPELGTSIKPEISFKVENMLLKKDNETILNLEKFDSKINFYRIFSRTITLEKLGADNIYLDINKLEQLSFKEEKKKEKKSKPFFSVDCFNALFYIKKCAILYNANNGVKIKFLAKDLEISDQREPKMLHFKIYLDLFHDNQHLRIFLKDMNNVYFKDKKFHVDSLKFIVNHSVVKVKALVDRKQNYDVSFESENFEIENVNRFLNTNLVIPNGSSFVSSFKDFSGDFNFKFNMKNDGMSGFLKVNKVSAKLIPLADIPLTLTDGLLKMNPSDITFEDFQGYYGSNQKNKLKMTGAVSDYATNAKTDIVIKGLIFDEFAKYISKIAGIKINVIDGSLTEADFTCDSTGKMDIKGKIKLRPGGDILFEGASIGSPKFYREFDIDMSIIKENLLINHINYYISNSRIEPKTLGKPFVSVDADINMVTGKLNGLGFNIPEPLPSEFLNVLIGQRLFKNGTFSGNLKFVNSDKPYLDGKLNLKDAILIGQMLFIKDMSLKTDKNYLKVVADGFIRSTKYNFNVNLVNNLIFPLVVQDANINFDELDAERVMKTFAPRPTQPTGQTANNANRPKIELSKSNISTEYFDVEEKAVKTADNSDEIQQIVFVPNLLEIKRCMFNVGKGTYKKINFGNLHADLTLTPQGVLEIKSNKFDFAEGISTLKVYSDFVKEKYSIRLGAKDVDTNAIATSILNLDKEISGKAKALLEFYTDSSMKLNGKIQFEINDGQIAKLSLVQYVLNVAAVFRNPLTMISPSILLDIVNQPESSFKKIEGTVNIKDNSISGMFIKSSSPQLSALIAGRINLENMDASLRIYTKFNEKSEGMFGFLRGLSLNTLAKSASSYTKAEAESYYAAELSLLPKLDSGDDTAQVFLTKFDGNLDSSNFISSLKKIK